MKQIAVVLAALLSLVLVTPALAQPFADVPTDHWAYDAIAELAAKGLVEGYPDGAFRGDRAMTRYEMAMVVARLLARIEAIKIPPLPPDLVRRAELAKSDAANAAARAAITKKLAVVQRLVAEFRAELAALGVRVTAVEEELAAIWARLDDTRVTGDFRVRYNVYPVGSVSGGGTNRAPDARIRMRLTFTGEVSANTTAVVRLWAANNAACQTGAPEPSGVATGCSIYDVRFGNNYNYGVVSFDMAYLDIKNTYGANLWRVGRQFITVAGMGPFGTGLLYDPANAVGTAAFLVVPITGITNTGLSDGIRGDFTWGPINARLAVFRSAVLSLAPPAGITPGLGNAPALDHRVVELSTRQFIPGWTLTGTYYQAWQHPTCTGLNCSGGTGYSVGIAGTIAPGFSLYGDIAWWGSIPTPGAVQLPNATAYRIGGNINFAQLTGMTTWNPNLDWEYHRFGRLPAGAIPPTETYATTIAGQVFAWNMEGWLVRLNLTFSPTTRAWILYESGNVLCATVACVAGGRPYYEWWIRVTHTLRPNTVVALNYFKGNNRTIGSTTLGPGDYFNFYRAEMLHNW